MLSFLLWGIGWEFFLPYKICRTLSAVDTGHHIQMILKPPRQVFLSKAIFQVNTVYLEFGNDFLWGQRQAVSQAALRVINTSDEAIGGRDLHFGLTLTTVQYTLDEP